LIDVLLLHRSMPATAVIAGITAALQVGAVSADVVAVEARMHANGATTNDIGADAAPPLRAQRVVSLTNAAWPTRLW
jgi:hypothetical protein